MENLKGYLVSNSPLSVIGPAELIEARASGDNGAYSVTGVGPLWVHGEAHCGSLLMAHGAGAGHDSAFLQALRDALARHGVQTLSVEFAYMQRMKAEGRRRPPSKVAGLVEELRLWRDHMSHPSLPPLWLAGKSMGGRVASLLAAEDGAPGLVLAGYPFHPPAKPQRLRLDHWPDLACPTLVLQGTRDPFGRRDEVEGYTLAASSRVHWLEGGDHDWTPTRSSGLRQADLIEQAAVTAARFMTEHSAADQTPLQPPGPGATPR